MVSILWGNMAYCVKWEIGKFFSSRLSEGNRNLVFAAQSLAVRSFKYVGVY